MAIDAERREAIRQEIQATDLDALVSFSPTEVLLMSGYWPVMGVSGAFFSRDGEVSVILPEDEIEIAQATSNANLHPYKPSTLNRLSRPKEALLEPTEDLLRSLKSLRNVGVNFEDSTQPAGYQSVHHFHGSIPALLKSAAADMRIQPADTIFRRLKSIKTTIEIDLIYQQAQLAQHGFAEARRMIVPGKREDEIAAAVEAAYAVVAQKGFQRARGYYFCMSGPNSAKAAGAFAQTRTRTLQQGDMVMIHANTVGDGYWTDITRSFIVGESSEEQQAMETAIVEARSAALKKISPGETAAGVDTAARDVLEKYGYGKFFKHGTGHGVGFAAADPRALPRMHPQSSDVLEAGMTFNVEPAIYLDGIGGLRHCDVVLCTEKGAKVLTDFE